MSEINRREFLRTGAKGTALFTMPALTSFGKPGSRYPSLSRAVRRGETPADSPVLFNIALVTDSHVRLEKDDPQNLYPSDQWYNANDIFLKSSINSLFGSQRTSATATISPRQRCFA